MGSCKVKTRFPIAQVVVTYAKRRIPRAEDPKIFYHTALDEKVFELLANDHVRFNKVFPPDPADGPTVRGGEAMGRTDCPIGAVAKGSKDDPV